MPDEREDTIQPNSQEANEHPFENDSVDGGRPSGHAEQDFTPEVISSDKDGSPALGFSVVALGASAGGLEAFRRVLRHVPGDTGMAFLLVQHLAPHHSSQLASLLSQATSMPVQDVEHGTLIQPNRVYVIPPNTLMSISGGILELTPRLASVGVPMPIDHLFRSLAEDQKGGAIGVVLSGTDSDGALGLQAIREQGGIAIAQTEDSAAFPGMPHRAAEAGPVDLILTPEEIARELGRIGHAGPRPILTGQSEADPDSEELSQEQSINSILVLLGKATGIDFRGYKRPTLRRRIERRMLLLRQVDLKEYADYLKSNQSELMALSEDALINVTGFFRNPESFQAFDKRVVPELLKDRSPDVPIRVWVPGCSTGEEVYSLAMCLSEASLKLPSPVAMQFFGTDLSERMLSLARAGVYKENQLADVSAERRGKFFVPVQGGFQIVKSIRELCVFARQNVCFDPPFSRLDLISCRNLLIYLGPTLQRNVITTFHYALRPGGYLMLGSSESLRGFPELFSVLDKPHKVFKRSTLNTPSLAMIGRGFAKERGSSAPASNAAPHRGSSKPHFDRAAERIILREYGPPWVVVNEKFEIVHSWGNTSSFLQLPTGEPSFQLLQMAREDLRGELRKLLREVRDRNLLSKSSVIRDWAGNEARSVVLTVWRVPNENSDQPYFLVVFASPTERPSLQESKPELDTHRVSPDSQGPEADLLREELTVTSQRLQGIIDERDAANQELTSANEEIQSSNEELQSINEELETAKEELQSSNEELSTLNEELQNRNKELGHINDDLSNLMSSTTIPILLLDNELRIRRMTAVSESLLGLQQSDLGRPLGDLRLRLSVEDVESLAGSVLQTLTSRELELQDREGKWRELRLRPYRTADNRIEGVVVVLVDIDQLRKAKVEAIAAREFAESVIQSVHSPLLVLHGDLRVRLANQAFYTEYGLNPAEVENQLFLNISRNEWDLPGFRAALAEALTDSATLHELEFETHFAGREKKSVCIYVRPVQPDGERLILVVIEDITAQKNASRILIARQEELKTSVEAGTVALRESESALLRSREQLRDLAAGLLNAQEEERRRISRELHDDLSQKVAKLQFDIEILEQKLPVADVKHAKQALLSVRDQTGMLADDLRRVAHGLHPSSLDHLGLVVALRSYIDEFSRSTAISIEFSSIDIPRAIPIEISTSLYRIVQEALRNVAKHAPQASVDITVSGSRRELRLSILDSGEGFDPAAARMSGGLGLISMQERVRLVQGQFSLETQPGQGVHISISVPLPAGGN